jgi:hypothetical protein
VEETTKILITVRLESADEELDTAKELLKLDRYRDQSIRKKPTHWLTRRHAGGIEFLLALLEEGFRP